MMIIPPYPVSRLPGEHYPEYDRDKYYFRHTIDALKHWDKHQHYGHGDRPTIPNIAEPDLAFREMKQFFDHEYNPSTPLCCERFNEAADLLKQVIETNGVNGMYSFFRVLSHIDDGSSNMRQDEERFRKVLSDVFVPHFEPYPTEEIVHGVATVGHTAVAALSGLVHAPAAAYSALKFRKLRNERHARRESPPLDVIDNILPLLTSMHTIAQHSIDVLNVVTPVQDRSFPNLPPINIRFLEDTLDRVRHADDSPDYHHR